MASALDPQIKMLLDAAQQSGAPGLHTVSPTEARDLYRAGAALFASIPEQAITINELTCPGAVDPITLRRYRPTADSSVPLATLIFSWRWVDVW